MEFWMLLLYVIPTLVSSITVSSNGNSPEIKITGMTVDSLNTTEKSKNIKIVAYKNTSETHNIPELSINERYRRLIPYMTFYYANDLIPPPSKANVQNDDFKVEKAVVIETATESSSEREPKVIYKTHKHKNIPRYNGNRLTQFNIASSNPSKIFYKEIPVLYYDSFKSNYNTQPTENNQNRNIPLDRYIPKQIKAPSAPFSTYDRKPLLNIYQNEDFSPTVQYYSSDQNETPQYRLIPYEQTPPVKVIDTPIKYYNPSETISKEPVYVKQRPVLRPQPFYDIHYNQRKPHQQTRKPTTISEIYYERQPPSSFAGPIIENGFKPILNNPPATTEIPIYTSTQEREASYDNFDIQNQKVQLLEPTTAPFYNSYNQELLLEQPTPKKKQESSNSVILAELLNSLQINKSIPKPITRENVGNSIRTLLNVLSTLKAAPLQDEVGVAVVSTPKPIDTSEVSVVPPAYSLSSTTPKTEEPGLHEERYLAPINPPSQYLDDYPTSSGSSQRYPLPVISDEVGGTPGRPGVDYPILTVIPTTKFTCKTQRYKGFFADPETRCQVWHYCDLNGGQASFLCPNGTIFSQAALTCDWWFNVRCASTAQLYVLNESLYKYILPHSPKFPEDYSGPLVDKYLSLKFKEMEEQFKKNKKKTTEKIDSGDEYSSSEKNSSNEENIMSDKSDESTVNRADVIIQTPGRSGNVQRLQDE